MDNLECVIMEIMDYAPIKATDLTAAVSEHLGTQLTVRSVVLALNALAQKGMITHIRPTNDAGID